MGTGNNLRKYAPNKRSAANSVRPKKPSTTLLQTNESSKIASDNHFDGVLAGFGRRRI
jgi:hypothetical protein